MRRGANAVAYRLGTPSPWCARLAALGDICSGSDGSLYPTGPFPSGPMTCPLPSGLWCRHAGCVCMVLCIATRPDDKMDICSLLYRAMNVLVGACKLDQKHR